MSSSMIIRGGTVYDGSLNPPYIADIKIDGDKIVAIGKISDEGSRIIDATGYIVTPGFIDVHSHTDLGFTMCTDSLKKAPRSPQLKGNLNYIYQGVTTSVTGNCGHGYTNTTEWLDYLDSLHFGTNVYHLAPHGKTRLELFGTDQPTKLTAAQLQLSKDRIEKEMQRGAIGFSTGLEYAPGWLADLEELVEIAKVVKKYGGIYTSHIRNESSKGIINAIKEAIEIGRCANIPVQISHLKLRAPIGSVSIDQVLQLIEDARKEGLDVTADQYPYESGSSNLTILLSDKSVLLDERIKPELRTQKGKELIMKSVKETFEYIAPENVLISSCAQKKEYEGKTLKQVADLEGRDPAEVHAEMAFFDKVPWVVLFWTDTAILKQIMSRDYVFTASDGATIKKGAGKYHPRCYATFTKKIKHFAIDEKVIDLNFAIRSMTSLPAEKFKMQGRGKIAEGYFADIAVINLSTLKDNATYLSPDNLSDGVVYLLVNGVLSIENGKFTGETGGRTLRRHT